MGCVRLDSKPQRHYISATLPVVSIVFPLNPSTVCIRCAGLVNPPSLIYTRNTWYLLHYHHYFLFLPRRYLSFPLYLPPEPPDTVESSACLSSLQSLPCGRIANLR